MKVSANGLRGAMPLGATLTFIVGGVLLTTIVLFALIVRWRILSDAREEMAAFRASEIDEVRSDLRGYVAMADRILRDAYEQPEDTGYLIRTYGDRLRFVIEVAESLIDEKLRAVEEGRLTTEEAQRQAIEAIRVLRYDQGVGYVWINDMGRPIPRMVMHPTIPALDGRLLDDPRFDCALGRNENLFVAFVDACSKDGEGFVDYRWPKPTPEGLAPDQPKLSYGRRIRQWGWILGTGVYVD
ncbi:MAG: cache domain-containing protein, partial [Patescibacteria group bacterium]|nr:cache domain-containing protein [Patescibacteria group bacterium]